MSVTKSSTLTDRNEQIRSESELILDIRSPVRLPPKNSSERPVEVPRRSAFRKSALIRSPTQAMT